MGFFSKIKEGLKKTKEAIAYKLNKLFTGGVLTDDFYDELEETLITSDIGAETTDTIMERLKDEIDRQHVRDTAKVEKILKDILVELLEENEKPEYSYPLVIMLSGVNGVGKTTAIGKLAKKFKSQGKSVTVAAADTFRAAASDQLAVWADRAGVRLIKHAEGADPAAVVFDAAQSVKSKKGDVLLVDTAGRLHNKKNLMEELKKIARVVERELPDATVLNYIVLDATTGQNAVSQVDIFNEAIDIDGIILTKLDGTAKGGVVLAIAGELSVPVVYVGVGEGIDDLEDFDAKEFVNGIMDGQQ
ncbi:MAG: signal recognition particle-docking protein FtsY [Clostridia bacterium]|jgi:fused signal recognition particle receptor|nr:signal recognition particle-docking protein FtsY [Clostridia bacterium]MCI9459627.1 signal recognition particle-docking protein FtsY [Clostridia bacterium]